MNINEIAKPIKKIADEVDVDVPGMGDRSGPDNMKFFDLGLFLQKEKYIMSCILETARTIQEGEYYV